MGYLSYRFTEYDILFLKKYNIHIYKNIVRDQLIDIFYKIITFVVEWTILGVWWCGVCIILTLLALKIMSQELTVTRVTADKIYHGSLYLVGKLLNILRNIYPNHSRKKIIYDKSENDPYLERYYLFLKNRETFAWNIFLHRFIKGDEDDIHDHPWGFFHVIISGGYWEYVTVNCNGETLDQGIKKVWRPAGHYSMVTSEYKHRIVLGIEKPWTLFIPFRKTSSWGFWVPLIWQTNGPCIEGSIKNDKHLNSTKWKKISHDTYLQRKAAENKDN